MTESYRFDPPVAPGPGGLTCTIPTGGVNALRELAVADDLTVILRDRVGNRDQFEAFACRPNKIDDPETPDRVTPDVSFVREVHTQGSVTMPDGVEVEFWGFEDPLGRGPRRPFPSPIIRVREGQIVHTTLRSRKNNHTIHHHGIEPTAYNDGVGHTSFEVGHRYTYQWRAAESGSYFYHCHKNTVLHFELGMYGPLIVDPVQGPGFVHRGREVVTYDHEALWITDDVDPVWHDPHQEHDAGSDCEDDSFDRNGHLRYFRPQYWMLSGVPHPRTLTDPKVTVNCRVGERVLIRLLNAAYGPVVLRLPFDAECIARDGHTLGGARVDRYSRPYHHPAGSVIELSTAQRTDLLVVPDRVGTFTVPLDFEHWVRKSAYGRVETTITVT